MTPMMRQWTSCKEKAGEALLLFRLGDFYEAFYDDADRLATALEITLTKRQDIPMAGIPVQTLDNYLEKLVAKGHVVAIAEQMGDPKETKGIVGREIVRTVSPATIIGSSIVPEKSHNFFASISKDGLAFVDHSTGAAIAIESGNRSELLDELIRRAPRELLVSKSFYKHNEDLLSPLKMRIEVCDDYRFDEKSCYDFLTRHFKVHSLTVAAPVGALLSHLSETLSLDISHIMAIQKDSLSSYMSIDQATLSHLELDTGLLPIIDKTLTPMGGRLLKSWLFHPLLSVQRITKRQDAVAELIEKGYVFEELLKPVRDLERLMMRISSGSASPRDLASLATSLEPVPALIEKVRALSAAGSLLKGLHDPSAIAAKIRTVLNPEPPARLSDGGVIRSSFSPELKELRELKTNSHDWMARYQTELKERYDIKTLKVGYNRAFGYFIEVSRLQSDRMPDTFTRRQTLVNNERFISPELKEFESKILGAEERIAAIESQLFHALRVEIAGHADTILSIGKAIAQLDALLSLSKIAKAGQMVRPLVDESDELNISEGRHPVVEHHLSSGSFIPNDTHTHRLMLITGPNMAGKSTYIRQVALIVLLAQMGSFVPAKSAHIGIVDKLFSRIGASDDLARGQSTFMVEMTETANILNNATERSLVILDEIGRGTSTYDGISIAWSVAEYLLKEKRAKTLFATHYFELTDLPGAVNYNVSVEESESGILFLRKIVPGAADKSYGIHVARLAGLPSVVLKRAYEILATLEEKPAPSIQGELFHVQEAPSPVIKKLQEVDTNSVTPLEALQLLDRLKHELQS